MKTMTLIAALAAACASGAAFGINKCVVDGKPVFQDAPCEEKRETVGEGLARRQRVEDYHRYLDELAAKGNGVVRREPRTVEPYPAKESGPMLRPRSRAAEEARQQRWTARIQEESERRNAESAARLTRSLDEASKACDGKPDQKPAVGMSDARFRLCTIHARFGGVTQVVAEQQDGIPLRLYIFSNPPHRVYSVDGVVTAIRP